MWACSNCHRVIAAAAATVLFVATNLLLICRSKGQSKQQEDEGRQAEDSVHRGLLEGAAPAETNSTVAEDSAGQLTQATAYEPPQDQRVQATSEVNAQQRSSAQRVNPTFTSSSSSTKAPTKAGEIQPGRSTRAMSTLESLFAPTLGTNGLPVQQTGEALTDEQVTVALRSITAGTGPGQAGEASRSIATNAAPPGVHAAALSPAELPQTSSAPAPPVDMGYLQNLMDLEGFGPPKFNVPKQQELPAADVKVLENLIEEELGPPKFAVRKSQAPGSLASPACETSNSPAAASSSAPVAAEQPGEGAPLTSVGAAPGKRAPEGPPQQPTTLVLEVTAGPAAGQAFVASDPKIEYKIGRNPDCNFQVLDQEISGRHAVLRWSSPEETWKLADVGSLNGTVLNSQVISTKYRHVAPEHALHHNDIVELGSFTKLTVRLRGPPHIHSDSDTASKRQHTETDAPPISSAVAAGAAGAAAPQPAQAQPATSFIGGTLRVQTHLPPPLINQHFPELGITLVVQQKLGADHKRLDQGCEDVAHWEVPLAPFLRSGLFCVFDGHHGVRAANLAKETLPGILRDKLTAAPAAATSGSAAGGGSQQVGGKKRGKAQQQQQRTQQQQQQQPQQLLGGRTTEEQVSLLRDVFLETDKAITMDEGCTASVLLVQYNAPAAGSSSSGSSGSSMAAGGSSGSTGVQSWKVQAANVGDSSVLLVNPNTSTVAKLSEDHRIAVSVAERERLAARGHTVRNRLFGLNISRMLGDRFLKDEDLGFLAEPYVSEQVEVSLSGGSSSSSTVPEQRPAAESSSSSGAAATAGGGSDKQQQLQRQQQPQQPAYLIVASDGLWDVIPEEKVGSTVMRAVAERAGSSGSGSGGGASAAAIADQLLMQALTLRSKDDITIMVLELNGRQQ